MKRAVLYLRVSTVDQTTANQECELRQIAGRMGCENGIFCIAIRCSEVSC
jgi:DNA invertase Pin-like site-specific DNA recombinase